MCFFSAFTHYTAFCSYGNSGRVLKDTHFSCPPPGQPKISQCLYYTSFFSHFQEKNVP
jgi:hypothetical protein